MSNPRITSPRSGAARFGALGFMAVALGCAAFAAYLVGNAMSASYTGTRVVPVVVAAGELSAGASLSRADVKVVEWPETAVPAGSFATVEELFAAHDGASPTVGILAGEPIVGKRLSGTNAGAGIAALVSPNMRAFALKVEDSVGFTGLVYPGAYVDVVATIRDPFGRGPSSRIAVQNARVLSLGMDADVATRRVREEHADRLTGSAQSGGTFVTLEVTPDEAEILSIARAEGTIDLILRNATDDAEVDTPGATPDRFSAFARVPDDGAVAAAEPAAPAPRRIRLERRKRRIQIVASEERDSPTQPRTSSKIETYNAN